ncbi:MAG TPA: DUF192 domain-containing protein [Candidatus Elarobacter sp.]
MIAQPLLLVAALTSSWCHAVPLEPRSCSTLVVHAPKATLRLAVADTAARREHGLMGVRRVPGAQGMIFAFADGDAVRDFWMKDTITPLDMVWVRGDGVVTAIAKNVPATKPNTPDDRVARRQGVGRYVIELAAGESARAGIHPGTHLRISDIRSE